MGQEPIRIEKVFKRETKGDRKENRTDVAKKYNPLSDLHPHMSHQ